MTYYGTKELAASFRTVRKNTLMIAKDIGEEHYGFRAVPETRTVAQTLVHISMVCKLQEQIHGQRLTNMEDFDFPTFFGKMMAEEAAPRSKAQIIALLEESGERFASWLETLTEDFLGERVKMRAGMTPPDKSRFEMILGVKEHEMHHRGQLMVMERLVGIEPHLTRDGRQFMAAMAAKQ